MVRPTIRSRERFRRASKEERGASALEFAIIYAWLLLLIMMAVHFGLMFNAVLSVEDAAGEALEAYTARDGGAAQAQNVVDQILGGDGTVPSYDPIQASDTGGLATITVTAQSVRVVPWIPVSIERTVTGPMEAFVTETERNGP